MAVWQVWNHRDRWECVTADVAVFYLDAACRVRLTTDPATLRDCWHCGRVMEQGQVDSMGRDWCGCMQVEFKRMIAEAWRRKENERSLT